jgi:hypothetical protein
MKYDKKHKKTWNMKFNFFNGYMRLIQSQGYHGDVSILLQSYNLVDKYVVNYNVKYDSK